MNVDEILKYKRPQETYYDIIGCAPSSTIEQINREYKIKALQLHPDKNSHPESLEKFRLLQTAKDTLTDESSRKSYDRWLSSGINIPFEQWQNRKGHSMHWAPPSSMKLSIKTSELLGQGSDRFGANDSGTTQNDSFLDKFRKYEI